MDIKIMAVTFLGSTIGSAIKYLEWFSQNSQDVTNFWVGFILSIISIITAILMLINQYKNAKLERELMIEEIRAARRLNDEAELAKSE